MAPSPRPDTQAAANQDATCIACQTVFDTAELLEQIILHLPAKQLFTTQRICKAFANAIATSPAIQVKMFKRLSTRPEKQTPESTNPSVTGKQPAQPEASREAEQPELAADLPLQTVLSPWLVVIPKVRQCVVSRSNSEAKGVKVKFKWRRRCDKDDFVTTEEDSYLDTYFCDPPCHTIRVTPQYLVDGDAFEYHQDVQIDKPMTIREVLAEGLKQVGFINDRFAPKTQFSSESIGAAIKQHEQEKGCADGSKTVLSNVEFILHGVFDLVGPEGEMIETREQTWGGRLVGNADCLSGTALRFRRTREKFSGLMHVDEHV